MGTLRYMSPEQARRFERSPTSNRSRRGRLFRWTIRRPRVSRPARHRLPARTGRKDCWVRRTARSAEPGTWTLEITDDQWLYSGTLHQYACFASIHERCSAPCPHRDRSRTHRQVEAFQTRRTSFHCGSANRCRALDRVSRTMPPVLRSPADSTVSHTLGGPHTRPGPPLEQTWTVKPKRRPPGTHHQRCSERTGGVNSEMAGPPAAKWIPARKTTNPPKNPPTRSTMTQRAWPAPEPGVRPAYQRVPGLRRGSARTTQSRPRSRLPPARDLSSSTATCSPCSLSLRQSRLKSVRRGN